MVLERILAPSGFNVTPIAVVAVLLLPFLLTYAITTIKSALLLRSRAAQVRAPAMPYWIPFLGNAIPFASDTVGFMKGVLRTYGEIPVFLNLGFEELYVFKGRDNLLHLFEKSRDMSTKALTMISLITCFGLPAQDAKVYEEDDSGIMVKPHVGMEVAPERRVFHLTHQGFTALSGPALNELSKQFIQHFSDRIFATREGSDGTWLEFPDIYQWIRRETFIASTTALFGEHIVKLNPTLAQDFWDFDAWMPLILKKLPRWLIPGAFRSRDASRENVLRWHKHAQEKIDPADESLADVLWEPIWGAKVMRDRAIFYNKIPDISPIGHAACDLGMLWGANANVGPAVGWSLFQIVADKSLEDRVRKEVAPAFSTDSPDSVDIARLNACPLLKSVVAEVLRVNVSIFIHRVPTVPEFKLGKWMLEKDQLMISSIYFAHRDEEKWNTGRTLHDGRQEHPLDDFWAERFLEYPNDPLSGPSKKDFSDIKPHRDHESIEHDDSQARCVQEDPKMKGVYVPFGGGVFQCPGRFYARNEIYIAIATMLWAFDIELTDPEAAKKTGRNMNALGLGTFSPDRENTFRLRSRVR